MKTNSHSLQELLQTERSTKSHSSFNKEMAVELDVLRRKNSELKLQLTSTEQVNASLKLEIRQTDEINRKQAEKLLNAKNAIDIKITETFHVMDKNKNLQLVLNEARKREAVALEKLNQQIKINSNYE